MPPHDLARNSDHFPILEGSAKWLHPDCSFRLVSERFARLDFWFLMRGVMLRLHPCILQITSSLLERKPSESSLALQVAKAKSSSRISSVSSVDLLDSRWDWRRIS